MNVPETRPGAAKRTRRLLLRQLGRTRDTGARAPFAFPQPAGVVRQFEANMALHRQIMSGMRFIRA